MTLAERAACIADKAVGTARGALRRRRVYDCALKMLEEAIEEITPQAQRINALSQKQAVEEISSP